MKDVCHYIFMNNSPLHCIYCVPLFYICGYYYVQTIVLLKVKDIYCHLPKFRRFAHTACVPIYILLLQSPQAVEWQLERHHFCGACCLWTRSTDELLLEQNFSATICSWTVCHVTVLIGFHLYIFHLYILYI